MKTGFRLGQAFGKLPNLHHIDLSRNALKPLHGTEFSRARGLATLILAGNKDVVAPNSPIVQTLKLKTLNLANCSITNFSDNIFENLTSLVQLYLEDNPLESVRNSTFYGQNNKNRSIINICNICTGFKCKFIQIFNKFENIAYTENKRRSRSKAVR